MIRKRIVYVGRFTIMTWLHFLILFLYRYFYWPCTPGFIKNPSNYRNGHTSEGRKNGCVSFSEEFFLQNWTGIFSTKPNKHFFYKTEQESSSSRILFFENILFSGTPHHRILRTVDLHRCWQQVDGTILPRNRQNVDTVPSQWKCWEHGKYGYRLVANVWFATEISRSAFDIVGNTQFGCSQHFDGCKFVIDKGQKSPSWTDEFATWKREFRRRVDTP